MSNKISRPFHGYLALAFLGFVLAPIATQAQAVREVPYFYQYNNEFNPSGSCQISTITIALTHFGAPIRNPDQLAFEWGTDKAQTVKGWEEIFNLEAQRHGLTIRDRATDIGHISQVLAQLDRGLPVPVHGEFTQSGHLIVLLGYDDDYYYAHDPGGDWTRGYGQGEDRAGRYARYPRRDVDRVIIDLTNNTVSMHELYFLPGPVTPVWDGALPDSLVIGQTVELAAGVEFVQRNSGVQIDRVNADLSALGGPADWPLAVQGDGSYLLQSQFTLAPSAPGFHSVTVAVSYTEEGIGQTAWLRGHIVALPPQHEIIFADDWGAGWGPANLYNAELNPSSQVGSYVGDQALAVAANSFIVEYVPEQPIAPEGYSSLRFAFHPGEAAPGRRPAVSVLINEDFRTVVKLIAGNLEGVGIDLEQNAWQVVDIPLTALAWQQEPIRSIRLFGNLRGVFYLDDIRLVAGRPFPITAAWQRALPDSVVAGQSLVIDALVELASTVEGGHEPHLEADLSLLGGPTNWPLESQGDGTYQLQVEVPVAVSHGRVEIPIHLQQRGVEQTYSGQLLIPVTVLPESDRAIFADALAPEWRADNLFSVHLTEGSTQQVYQGDAALAVEADNFIFEYLADEPVDPVGYAALHLAFHPGQVVANGKQAAFSVLLNGDNRTTVPLIGHFDLADPSWQTVVVPLRDFAHRDEPIASMRFFGNLQGAFHLDDIRLVAALPPEPKSPTDVEQYQDALPQGMALEQNYPNPFNSETAIGFTLAQAGSIDLRIYNPLGQEVLRLAQGWHPAGAHRLSWDGRDAGGQLLSSGVYLYRLETANRVQTRRLMMLK
ncbi:MAG: T9SS type A sorting domain-containing protein [Candidatus Latescibacteria bacterium]|nr:T9SS type A sorting domain-containing protein [Candidatus Latescibacterota bacterium]